MFVFGFNLKGDINKKSFNEIKAGFDTFIDISIATCAFKIKKQDDIVLLS